MKSYKEVYKELEQDKSVKSFCENIGAAEEAIRIARNMYARYEIVNNALALAIRALQEEGNWESEIPVTAEEIVYKQDWIAKFLTENRDEILGAVSGSFYLLSYEDTWSDTERDYVRKNASAIADAYHELFGD